MSGFEEICEDGKYRFVYLINNPANGKTYVGQHTTVDLHDGYFGSGFVLKRAINKHGKENFELGYLVFTEHRDELNEQERIWVDYFKNHAGRGNYNVANGGYRWQTEEINQKGSQTRKKRFASGELVVWNKGKTNIYSEESLRKMSESRIGIPQTKEANDKRSKTQSGVKRPQDVIEKIRKAKQENPKIYTDLDRDKIRQQMVAFNKENKIECPWCHKQATLFNAKCWHFDNCKLNPNCQKEKVVCPHCNKSGVKGVMMRKYHFDNCKHKDEKCI
jgi:group I intron endonuclease